MVDRVVTAPPLASTTIEVAGLVVRMESALLRPIFWAREGHPAFVSVKRPDLEVVFTFDDAYWERDLPWVGPNAVVDAPKVTRGERSLNVVTAYYQAEIDRGTACVHVRLASGFRPGGPLRTLCALHAPERGALLLRATRLRTGDSSVLVVGPPAEREAAAVGGRAFDGWVAVLERDGRYVACTTPFDDGDPQAEEPIALPLDALYCLENDTGLVPAGLGAVEAARRLFPYLCVVDREPTTIALLLDLVSRFVQRQPVYVGGGHGTRGA